MSLDTSLQTARTRRIQRAKEKAKAKNKEEKEKKERKEREKQARTLRKEQRPKKETGLEAQKVRKEKCMRLPNQMMDGFGGKVSGGATKLPHLGPMVDTGRHRRSINNKEEQRRFSKCRVCCFVSCCAPRTSV